MDGIDLGNEVLEGVRNRFSVEALAEVLSPVWVEQAIVDSDRQAQRERRLPPVVTVWLLILLTIFRHVSYANLLEKLHGSWWTRRFWSPNKPPTDSAVTKARDRLGVEPMRRLFERSVGIWSSESRGYLVAGRRAVSLDGVMYKTFDSRANREHFGVPGGGRGVAAFPQFRTMKLVDVESRLVLDVEHGPWPTSELELAERLLPRIPVGSLVLADRQFYAFAFLWSLFSNGSDFLVRAKTGRRSIKLRVVKILSVGDELVELTCPRYLRRRLAGLPDRWLLRRVRYRVDEGQLVEVLTTILDSELVTKREVADLYHDRWEVETTADELKTHLCACATVNHPIPFRGKTPDRVEQELYSTLIAYNLLRRLIVTAAAKVNVEPSRISFVATLERVREAVQDMQALPTKALPARYRSMLQAIARRIVPLRPGRHVPRGVRIKMSKYVLKYGLAA